MALFTKISVVQIVKDHFETLVNQSSGKPDGSDFFTFFWIPLITAFVSVRLSIFMDSNFVGILISALSIFVGLLLNVIVILFDIVKGNKVSGSKISVARESISNISFAILLSLLCIALSLLTQMEWGKTFKNVAHFVTYFIVTEFAVTLLMVLKRMYRLFVGELLEVEKTVKQDSIPRRQVEVKSGRKNAWGLTITFVFIAAVLIFWDKILGIIGF